MLDVGDGVGNIGRGRVREFGRVCERRKLRVNVDKSKVMCVGENVEPSLLNIMLNGERMEVVNSKLLQVPGKLFQLRRRSERGC